VKTKIYSKILILFFALLFTLQPLFSFSQIPSVKAQTEGPPDPPPTTVEFRFKDEARTSLQAVVTKGGNNTYNFKKQEVVTDTSKFIGERKLPEEATQFISYKLQPDASGPEPSCNPISVFGGKPIVVDQLYLIVYKLPDNKYYNQGLYEKKGTSAYYVFNANSVPNCIFVGTWETFISSINGALPKARIKEYLSTDTKEATCDDLHSKWGKLKDNFRELMIPVDGKLNLKYWTKDMGWDPDINMDKITYGNIAKIFGASLTTAGVGTLAAIYGTAVLDIEIEQQYVLNKDGLILFNSTKTLFDDIKKDIELLQSEENDSIPGVCPGIKFTKFYWNKDLESDPATSEEYESFAEFVAEIDKTYNNFLEIFAIATMKFTTDDDDGSSFCDKVPDNGIKGMLMQAFCGLIIILKTGADALYNFALRTLNSSIGLDTDIQGESSPEISIFSPGNVSTGGGGGTSTSNGFDTNKLAEYEKSDPAAPKATQESDAQSQAAYDYAVDQLGISKSDIRIYSEEEIKQMITNEVAAQCPSITGCVNEEAVAELFAYQCVEGGDNTPHKFAPFKEVGGRIVPTHTKPTIQLLSITCGKWGCLKETVVCNGACNQRKAIALNYDVKYLIYTGVKEHLGVFSGTNKEDTSEKRWKDTIVGVANDGRGFSVFETCWNANWK
jgi:hypothetical protein